MICTRRIAAGVVLALAIQVPAQDRPAQQHPPQEPTRQPPAAGKNDDADALDRALQELATQTPQGQPAPPVVAAGPPRDDKNLFELYKLSLDVLFSAGGSTASDSELDWLQAGGHDPRKRGFTIQNVELAMEGAVDPYFRANLNLVSFIEPVTGDTTVELEEAYLTTTGLPYGLEVQGGQFFTKFGRINPQHPHQWDFLDAPLVQSRILGPDGMRGPGVRVGWLTPLPWFSELHASVQNANGTTMASFLSSEEFFADRAIGGRPYTARDVKSAADLAYAIRFVNAFEPNDQTTVQIGLSGLFGPNATGPSASTRIFGSDLVVRWADDIGGRQGHELVWQSEFIARSYDAAGFVDTGDPNDPGDDLAVLGATLRDYGFYSQATWKLASEWRVGARYDQVSGSGDSYDAGLRSLVSRETDPFRADRWRITPMLEWSPTHFSRIRLQYSYDHAATLDGGDAHSIWIGGEVGIGAHAAHSF